MAGDANTHEFLETCSQKRQYRSEGEEIRKVLQVEPRVRLAALKEGLLHPSEAPQLDQLWVEFIITGGIRSVLTVIDVLERSDRLRGKLQAWLESSSTSGAATQSDRVHICQRLSETAGIVCDPSKGGITDGEDLDLRSMLKDWQVSPDHLKTIERVLPFQLSDEDKYYVALKAVAAGARGGPRPVGKSLTIQS